MRDFEEKLFDLAGKFPFYEFDVEEAAYNTVAYYRFPTQSVDGYNTHGCSPVVQDAQQWYDLQERCNSLRNDTEALMIEMEYAADVLDRMVYQMFSGVFGPTHQFDVVDVVPLSSRFEYLVLI